MSTTTKTTAQAGITLTSGKRPNTKVLNVSSAAQLVRIDKAFFDGENKGMNRGHLRALVEKIRGAINGANMDFVSVSDCDYTLLLIDVWKNLKSFFYAVSLTSELRQLLLTLPVIPDNGTLDCTIQNNGTNLVFSTSYLVDELNTATKAIETKKETLSVVLPSEVIAPAGPSKPIKIGIPSALDKYLTYEKVTKGIISKLYVPLTCKLTFDRSTNSVILQTSGNTRLPFIPNFDFAITYDSIEQAYDAAKEAITSEGKYSASVAKHKVSEFEAKHDDNLVRLFEVLTGNKQPEETVEETATA